MENHKVVRVLALDGGGIRGVAVARILEEIEKATGKKIHEQFDVVVGTSTGGLLSILMTCPLRNGSIMEAQAAKKLYLDEGARIFKKRELKMASCVLGPISWGLYKLYETIFMPTYTGEGLVDVISEYFDEETTLKDSVTCVGVVATDIQHSESILLNSMRAKLHNHDYRHNAPLHHVARATSAAPTYFPVVILKEEEQEKHVAAKSVNFLSEEEPEYVRKEIDIEDGGTTHNNPARLGMKFAKTHLKQNGLNPKDYQFQVISIGTGTLSGKQIDPSADFNGWKHPDGALDSVVKRLLIDDIFNISMKAQEVHNKVQEKLGGKEGPGSNYFRVQFKATTTQLEEMDNVSQKNMAGLISSAEGYLFAGQEKKVYSEHFQGLVELLNQNCSRPEKISVKVQQPMQDNQTSLASKEMPVGLDTTLQNEKSPLLKRDELKLVGQI